MAQVPALMYSEDEAIDYTPDSAVTGGDVVVINGIVGIAANDIAANQKGALQTEGLFRIPKTTAAIVAGLPVHWDPVGDPDSGVSGTGAANQLGIGTFCGVAAEATGSGDDYAIVDLNKPTSGILGVTAVTAIGTNAATAAALGQGFNVVTGGDGTKGVILPVAKPGMRVELKGVTAGVLKVWPQTGATINGLSESAAISLASGLIPATFIASSATQWYTMPLLPS